MHKTNVLYTILGGSWRQKVVSVFLFRHPKRHFLPLENGHFLQKCPFSSAKKWHFERPDLRTESKNLAKHPPKWLGRHLGHAFPFSGEYQANHVFGAVRSSFYTLKRPKNENGSYFFVYGSIILKKKKIWWLSSPIRTTG